MAHLEENAFDCYPDLVPTMCARYVDDIFLVVNSQEQLLNIKSYFESNSVLKFTYEEEKNNKIAFLDVLLIELIRLLTLQFSLNRRQVVTLLTTMEFVRKSIKSQQLKLCFIKLMIFVVIGSSSTKK